MPHNINSGGGVQPGSRLAGTRVRNLGDLRPPTSPSFWWRLQQAWKARHDLPMLAAQKILGQVKGVITVQSSLVGQVYRVDWSKLAPWQIERLRALLRAGDPFVLPALFGGELTDYGVLSRQSVTDNGVGFIVDAFQNSTELENMKYHGLGTNSSPAEGATNTALGTEITASHYNGSARPTGTTEEGASSNIYKTIGTHTQTTAGDTIVEHGVFSASSSGVLLDRHVFTGVPLAVSDSFVTTYQLTFTSGG